MAPDKIGQIVKFKNPTSEGEAEQRFVILEIFLDVDIPRAIVKYIDSSALSSTHTYLVSDLTTALTDNYPIKDLL